MSRRSHLRVIDGGDAEARRLGEIVGEYRARQRPMNQTELDEFWERLVLVRPDIAKLVLLRGLRRQRRRRGHDVSFWRWTFTFVWIGWRRSCWGIERDDLFGGSATVFLGPGKIVVGPRVQEERF